MKKIHLVGHYLVGKSQNTTATRFIVLCSIALLVCLVGVQSRAFALSNAAYIIDKPEQANLQLGEALYQTNCKSCHGRQLEGGVGFNLIDGQWVHGDSTQAIINSIKNGFLDKGMPAFKDMLTEQDIQNISAFIKSRRRGFENLRYKVWSISQDPNIQIDNLVLPEPLKTGQMKYDNLMDFTFTELNDFAIEFEGTLHAPSDLDSVLNGALSNKHQVLVWINDVLQEPQFVEWLSLAWPLKRGKQKIRIRYITTGTPDWLGKDLPFYIANKSSSIKWFPLSIRAKEILEDRKYFKPTSGMVERKRMAELPSYSLVIGTDDSLNFAFNTRTCSIVGAWLGNELNVGPNIFGRGRAGSEIEGVWLFRYPQEIRIGEPSSCQYKKYTRSTTPEVFFNINNNNYALSAQRKKESIVFEFRSLSEGQPKQEDIDISDGIKNKVTVSSQMQEQLPRTLIEFDFSGTTY